MQAVCGGISERGESVHVRVPRHHGPDPEFQFRFGRSPGATGYKGQRERAGYYSSHQGHPHWPEGKPGEPLLFVSAL